MSTPSPNQTITLQLEVPVKRGNYDRICSFIPDKSTPNKTITAMVDNFLAQYAQGGMLLRSTDIDYLSSITGEEINEPAQIAAYVENAVSRKQGSHTVEVSVDPAYIAILQERANDRGMTLDEIVTDCVSQCFDNGWLYEMLPGRQMAAFNERELPELISILGKTNFTGSDIMNALREKDAALQQEVA